MTPEWWLLRQELQFVGCSPPGGLGYPQWGSGAEPLVGSRGKKPLVVATMRPWLQLRGQGNKRPETNRWAASLRTAPALWRALINNTTTWWYKKPVKYVSSTQSLRRLDRGLAEGELPASNLAILLKNPTKKTQTTRPLKSIQLSISHLYLSANKPQHTSVHKSINIHSIFWPPPHVHLSPNPPHRTAGVRPQLPKLAFVAY